MTPEASAHSPTAGPPSLSPQACWEKRREVSVAPRTSAATNSPWMGLGSCVWSGHVTEHPVTWSPVASDMVWELRSWGYLGVD